MKVRLLSVLVFSGFFGTCFSQNIVNRMYFQVGYGFVRQMNLGLTVHAFDNYSSSLLFSNSSFPTGPSYIVPNGSFISERHQLKNNLENYSWIFGMTTRTLSGAEWCLKIGPSYGRFKEYTGIKVVQEQSSSMGAGTKYFEYSVSTKQIFGFTYRADLSFLTGDFIGVNLALEGNMNGSQNYIKLVAGLNFGLVRELSKNMNESDPSKL